MPIRIHIYIRPIIAFLLCLGIYASLNAQGRVFEEDVIYLKNGSMLRGEIIQHKIGDYVKIRLYEGIVFTYKTDEIDRITREAAKFTKVRLKLYEGHLPTRFPEKGDLTTQISYGLAINQTNNRALANFTGQIRTLYRWHRLLNVGLGTGFDFYEGGLIIPAFAEVQGDILPTRVTPYYAVQGGYGIGAGGSRNHLVFNGGFMAHAAVGIHWHTSSKRSYFASIGYKNQETYQEFREFSPDFFPFGFPTGQIPDPPLVIGNRRYRKIVLQFSYTF